MTDKKKAYYVWQTLSNSVICLKLIWILKLPTFSAKIQSLDNQLWCWPLHLEVWSEIKLISSWVLKGFKSIFTNCKAQNYTSLKQKVGKSKMTITISSAVLPFSSENMSLKTGAITGQGSAFPAPPQLNSSYEFNGSFFWAEIMELCCIFTTGFYPLPVVCDKLNGICTSYFIVSF